MTTTDRQYLRFDAVSADPMLKRLAETAGRTPVTHAAGLWGSSAPLVVAECLQHAPRTCLYIAGHATDADHARDDLELFLGQDVEIFPAFETLSGEGGAAGEVECERMRICRTLADTDTGIDTRPTVIVAPVQALMQPVPVPEVLRANTVQLTVGKAAPWCDGPEALVQWVIDRGYERLDLVEAPGDVAHRGDIVDLFVPGEDAPVRIQFFDDTVESVRRFDVGTQRSGDALNAFTLTALKASANPKTSANPKAGAKPRTDDAPIPVTQLLDYLPKNALIVIDAPAEVQEMGETLLRRIGPQGMFKPTDVFRAAADFAQLHLSRFGAAVGAHEPDCLFNVRSLSRFETAPADAVEELCKLAADHEVHVVCDSTGEQMRLREMIEEIDARIAKKINFHIGVLHRGFDWPAAKTIVVAHHEIFHRHRRKRRLRRMHAGRPLESWTDLQPGEIVVHVVHGIARYQGLVHLNKGDSAQQEEFLTLEFAEKAVVHVPCTQIDLVQKYIGPGGRKPELSKLGGKRWSRTKEKVAESVAELAQSLLHIQAVRNETAGTAYPTDTEWQREFEAAFIYEETEDQLIVAAEIKEDLRRSRPMDRLICGDVGYGKTELAMRAAFKVAEYGRQVAVLVPTTVLAEQHHETFSERMREYPFSIDCLSRFRSAKELKKTVDRIRKGQVDIVIGTHRLLSKDIHFVNLGLVIIDEEQRFGVEHKEKLKAMRETVDVLTMTATPIPRTLHMAVTGIRDISSLHTPPVDRRSILTHVRPFSRDFIREAILREINRDGQVYFIHNFVQSIATMADTIRSIVPECRVLYGHGQMPDGELEDVMHRFVRREADILVATTIIESGIDNPNVNTIFINRAERFGLADLHQLRGRVGRSDRRAFCYPLLSPKHRPTPKAAKRLKTIEEFSELGAGFRIAMRDLEIRGAGNLLGSEQSGHIAAVGYDMYCRLLNQAVRRLNREPDPTPKPVQIDLDVAAHVPPHYIASDRSRVEVYRRIADTASVQDLRQVETDLVDAFGQFPQPVQRLLELAEIRIRARECGITTVTLKPPDVVFTVESLQTVEPVFRDAPGSVRMPDGKTIHLRLPPRYLEQPTLITVLRRMLENAAAVESSS